MKAAETKHRERVRRRPLPPKWRGIAIPCRAAVFRTGGRGSEPLLTRTVSCSHLSAIKELLVLSHKLFKHENDEFLSFFFFFGILFLSFSTVKI